MKRVKINPEIAASIDLEEDDGPQLPTGAITPEGKAISSKNAVRHGLDSKEIILSHLGETPEAWNTHLAGVVEHFNPQDGFEHQIVEEIGEVMWLMKRVSAYRRNTTKQAHEAANRRAFREMERGEMDARPEYWEERAYLPDIHALEKADRHHGRLVRQLSALTSQLRQSRQDRRIDVAINIGLAILHKYPDLQNEPPYLDIIDQEQT